MADEFEEDEEDIEDDEQLFENYVPRTSRRGAVTNDDEIDMILAGRVKKISISISENPKTNGKRIQKTIIDSDADFNHLLGEVTGETYDIHGRPELDLLTIGFKFPIDDDSVNQDVVVPYNASKCLFILSDVIEHRLLRMLANCDKNELVLRCSVCQFGDYEFNTIDSIKHRVWRRYIRENMIPLLKNANYMAELEEKIRRLELKKQREASLSSDTDSASDKEDIESIVKDEVIVASHITEKVVPVAVAQISSNTQIKKGLGGGFPQRSYSPNRTTSAKNKIIL